MDETKEPLESTRITASRTYVYRLSPAQNEVVLKLSKRIGLSQNDLIKYILDDVLQTQPNMIIQLIKTQVDAIIAETKERNAEIKERINNNETKEESSLRIRARQKEQRISED